MTMITINGLTDEQNETIRDIIENEYILKQRFKDSIMKIYVNHCGCQLNCERCEKAKSICNHLLKEFGFEEK